MKVSCVPFHQLDQPLLVRKEEKLEVKESEKKSAMAELKGQVAGLSLEIAEKVVRQELSNKDKQIELVESMLGDAKLN